jgi:hypothetical protein
VVEVLRNIVNDHDIEEGPLKLRFEQIRFAALRCNEYNGKILTACHVGHTVNSEKQSPVKKQKLDASDAPMSLRAGTRLSRIRETESPYMGSTVAFTEPQPPLALTSYTLSFKDVQAPFRATIVGIIHDLEDAEPTQSGELRRNFKLADEHGMWMHCVAHGRHAESESLENMRRIVAYFCTARPAVKESPQTLWLFKDAFIVPLDRRIVSPLVKQVIWQ